MASFWLLTRNEDRAPAFPASVLPGRKRNRPPPHSCQVQTATPKGHRGHLGQRQALSVQGIFRAAQQTPHAHVRAEPSCGMGMGRRALGFSAQGVSHRCPPLGASELKEQDAKSSGVIQSVPFAVGENEALRGKRERAPTCTARWEWRRASHHAVSPEWVPEPCCLREAGV